MQCRKYFLIILLYLATFMRGVVTNCQRFKRQMEFSSLPWSNRQKTCCTTVPSKQCKLFFFNYKGTFSILSLAVVYANYLFDMHMSACKVEYVIVVCFHIVHLIMHLGMDHWVCLNKMSFQEITCMFLTSWQQMTHSCYQSYETICRRVNQREPENSV